MSPPKLTPAGLDLDGEPWPLYAASIHYWRLDPAVWVAAVEAARGLGFRMVDLYVPWAVHEVNVGHFDFGTTPRLDVGRFLRIIGEAGLKAIVRPGPHINAELTGFGIPQRVLWDPACQARSPRGNPVILPMLPSAFPVPSYASDAFHRETALFFQNLGPVLIPHLHPKGPVVMVQVDNEGALYFRDSAYEQDYHPDAVALYRAFLRERHGDDEGLRRAYGDPFLSLDTISPPRRFDARTLDQLPRHLEWVEFHEELLARAMRRFREALEAAGITGVLFSHNLPPGQDATPLNPARLRSSVDLVGLDYYHKADPNQRRILARRTTELVARCEGLSVPPYAAEMGAGFPPFFPPLDERDSEFTLLAALAYGLRGFNLYMAVARDRWVGGPINDRGQHRPSARFYARLIAALDRLHFAELRRATPVRLLTPRSLRRLTRAMHAFGPATGTFFSVLGAGARERCLEDTLGLEGPLALEGEAFLRAFEESLEVRGVPFAFVGGEDADIVLGGARWVIGATTGGLKPALLDRLGGIVREGAKVTLGPRVPTRDGAMHLLSSAPDLTGIEIIEGVLAPSEADRLVSRAIEQLALPCHACDPDTIFACIHEDRGGVPRALVVLNPTAEDVVGRVGVPGGREVTDVLEEHRFQSFGGVVELRVPARSGRLLALE
ncbi:MAG: beta-galactosidase [Myxococcales bacterium]|nr:beta-galactosidase [Polyangiaceae bacterium]MDW8248964.1 beta-galactosidase [Myxococcales bacterium]